MSKIDEVSGSTNYGTYNFDDYTLRQIQNTFSKLAKEANSLAAQENKTAFNKIIEEISSALLNANRPVVASAFHALSEIEILDPEYISLKEEITDELLLTFLNEILMEGEKGAEMAMKIYNKKPGVTDEVLRLIIYSKGNLASNLIVKRLAIGVLADRFLERYKHLDIESLLNKLKATEDLVEYEGIFFALCKQCKGDAKKFVDKPELDTTKLIVLITKGSRRRALVEKVIKLLNAMPGMKGYFGLIEFINNEYYQSKYSDLYEQATKMAHKKLRENQQSSRKLRTAKKALSLPK
jgi:hypothetical protein